jgi:hypothetical protein
LDQNDNGTLDPGERSMTTGPDGFYSFGQLPPGAYSVREVVPTGWIQTNPGSGPYRVTVGAGQSVTCISFGNQAANTGGRISGYVWNDLNGDRWATNEPWLAGWTVYLDTNGNGTLESGEPTVVTGADGYYAFSQLSAGTYTVREVIRAGWRQTLPQSGSYSLSLNVGQSVKYISFGNLATS